jgi:hypothetical protein
MASPYWPAQENRLAQEVPLSGGETSSYGDLAKRDHDERININTLYRARKHQPAAGSPPPEIVASMG